MPWYDKNKIQKLDDPVLTYFLLSTISCPNLTLWSFKPKNVTSATGERSHRFWLFYACLFSSLYWIDKRARPVMQHIGTAWTMYAHVSVCAVDVCSDFIKHMPQVSQLFSLPLICTSVWASVDQCICLCMYVYVFVCNIFNICNIVL